MRAGTLLIFHLAFVHARVQCRFVNATNAGCLRHPRSRRSRRDLALLEMVMYKHQRVAHAWYVKYERLRHATHEYKSILPDHILCHACGNIVDFHLAFVHARVQCRFVNATNAGCLRHPRSLRDIPFYLLMRNAIKIARSR
jgi:hypothetical protein